MADYRYKGIVYQVFKYRDRFIWRVILPGSTEQYSPTETEARNAAINYINRYG